MPAPLTLISLAGMLLVLGTAPAVAQDSTAQRAMPVIGSAPQVCTLQRGTIRSGALVNILGLDGDTLRIEQFTDPQTLAARAASATVTFAAVCNYPHRIRLESQNNGLWPTDGRRASTWTGWSRSSRVSGTASASRSPPRNGARCRGL